MHKNDPRLVEYFEEEFHNGIGRVYKFKNGFGASVVKHDFSYGGKKGLWELALLDSEGELIYNGDYPDVVGYLNDPQVDRELQRIARY